MESPLEARVLILTRVDLMPWLHFLECLAAVTGPKGLNCAKSDATKGLAQYAANQG